MPCTRYPRLGRGGAPAAAISSSRMTSNTVGRSWPPKRAGQLSPKKPASNSAVCHSAWRAQYSSSVDDVGSPGLFSASHAAKARPELGFGGRVTKVHRSPPTAFAAARAVARRRRRTTATTAARAAGTRARCTPTCSRSRRAPAPRSRTRCARRGRSTPWRRGPRATASSGARLSTAHAACNETLSEPSIRQCASASRCCTAWNEPTGTPYCRRSAAYATVTSSTPRITPTRSALVSARPSAVHAREIVGGEQPSCSATASTPAFRAGISRTAPRRSVPPRGPVDRHPREPEAVAVRRPTRTRRVAAVGVDGVERRAVVAPAHDRASVSAAENATTAPSTAGAPARRGEVARQHRTGERARRPRRPERVGDDRGLDAAREWCRRSPVVARARANRRRAPRPRAACARVASSRSATVVGPSSRASCRADRRSSACSGVSRVSTSGREDRDAGGAGRAVELRVADLRIAGHLPVAGLAAQLQHDLVHLPQARRADRLAVRDEAAVGVDRAACRRSRARRRRRAAPARRRRRSRSRRGGSLPRPRRCPAAGSRRRRPVRCPPSRTRPATRRRSRPAVSSIGSHGLCTSNAPSRRVRTVVARR